MKNIYTKLLILILLIVVISSAWWGATIYIERYLFPPTDAGVPWATRAQFGGMFGAISSLMTALNLAFLVYAILLQAKETSKNNEISKWQANYTYLLDAKKLITDHPEVLELHGLPANLPEELEVTSAQVAYVVLDLKAADLYYRMDGGNPITMTRHRKNLLKNEKYRKIASKCLIEGTLLPDSAFSKALRAELAPPKNECTNQRHE